MIVRQLATTWVKANCPLPDVQHNFLCRLDEGLRQGVGCSFIVGGKLTKAGKAYLVYCHCGELFAFQLTQRQAAQLEVNETMLVSTFGRNQHHHGVRPEPPVRLERVEIDNGNTIAAKSPIAGLLKYHCGQSWHVPLAIQATCEPVGQSSVLLYHHLDLLPQGEGEIRFSLPGVGGLQNREGKIFRGVVPLFFQLYIVEQGEQVLPLHPGSPKSKRSLGQVPQMTGEHTLGVPFIPRSPLPAVMLPEMLGMPLPNAASPHPPSPMPFVSRFSAISDIRAILVEIN